MSNVSIYAMVVERARIDDARQAARLLEEPTLPGGAQGWTYGVDMFEGMEQSGYLLAIADGKSRIVSAAPQIVLIEDNPDSLCTAVRIASDSLRGEARWFVFTDATLVTRLNKIFTDGGCYDARRRYGH